MTSENLLSAESGKPGFTHISLWDMQKNLFKRRLWPIALALLVYFIYHVGFTVLFLTTSLYGSSSVDARDLQRQAIAMFDYDTPVWFITAVGAVILGIQGFAYLDNRAKLDFYESQPVGRRNRFFSIVLNSFIIYAGAYLVTLIAGLLITAFLGGMSRAVFMTAMVTFGKNLLLFLAVYAMAVLAVMLTGNVIVSILAAGVFLGYELILNVLIITYKQLSFMSYYDGSDTKIFSSPVFWYFQSGLMPHILTVLFGVVVLALAYYAYSIRRNESAGEAVLHRPVRIVVKIAIAVLGGLLFGLIFFETGGAGVVFAAIVGSVITGCVMETIYNFDIKAMFKNWPSLLVAALVAVGCVCIFIFDVFGFDRWIPDPDKVEYAYIETPETNYAMYHDEEGNYMPSTEYYNRYMHLTDIEAVNVILKDGYETNKMSDGSYSGSVLRTVVAYRMKNGSVQYRDIRVSAERPEILEALNKVIGSEEFKEGFYPLYHDTFMEKHSPEGHINYWNGDSGQGYSIAGGETYAAFCEAYVKDLEQFDFSFAADNLPIGVVMAVCDNDTNHPQSSYPVYESYTNTIEFLKAENIYQEPCDITEDDLNWYNLATGFNKI